MCILVTGGTGYIGSHTVVELLNEGYDVIIADSLVNSRMDVVDGIQKITGKRPGFEKIDLCDREKVIQLFNKYPDIEAVVHFAAFKSVNESVESPLMYYSNNLLSLINVLDGMKKCELKRIVFSSSCTVYGQPDKLPVDESAQIKEANSPYGNTKQIAEEILRDLIGTDKSYSCISLRYFNPIGAHPSAEIGELPLGKPNNLVPFITQTAIGIRDYLSVFGNDYNTGDGSCIRDYINVTDLAKAHIVALKRLIEKKNRKNFEVFNLGTGRGVSVFQVINEFQNATGQKIKYIIAGRRPGDVEQVWADTSLANRELGWYAGTPLNETLLSAWNWEKKFRSRK